ncbi:MAG: DUF4302 domain-containing protein [Sphingobacteriaceae bacterium]|nr:MAG: DUF4302 domain-containing protein [Sphingobacteriaceae bacterium]
MKKLLYYSILFAVCLSACKKDGIVNYPIETSFTDPNVPLATYKTALTASADGWKMVLTPGKSGLYGGYIKFETTGDSKYVLDNTTAAASTPAASNYTLNIYKTNPSISFSKGSAFAAFALSSALGIDTSFTFKSAKGDTIQLSGNLQGSNLTLIKATKQESDDYLAGKMVTPINTASTINLFRLYYKRFTMGGKNYDLSLNTKTKTVTFNYSNNSVFARFATDYYYNSNGGITLKQAFTDGSNTISSLNALTIDVPNNKATFITGTTTIAVGNFAAPLIADPTAARRFYLNTAISTSWLSYTGFTVDGVTDAYKLSTIPNFNYLLFYPSYQPTYDRLGFMANSALAAYGPAIQTGFSTDGRIGFTYFGAFGTPPAAYATVVNATRDKMIDVLGFYVVQTGPNTYDWVSARDGRSWISFEQ